MKLFNYLPKFDGFVEDFQSAVVKMTAFTDAMGGANSLMDDLESMSIPLFGVNELAPSHASIHDSEIHHSALISY